MASVIAPISDILARRLQDVAVKRLADEPVIALQGPRTVGKSTLLSALANSFGVDVIDLDDPGLRSAASADPGAFVEGSPPVCIDEYQHVPAILDAIKAELNRQLRPGRFVIAGSTRYDALPLATQSLTGRVHLLTLWPLTQGEIQGVRENLLEALLDDPPSAIPRGATSNTTRQDYVARVTAGGMPIPLARSTLTSRNRWFDDYVQLVLDRDVRELASLRRREQLPLLLTRLAAQTARVLNLTSVSAEAGLDRVTATDYVKLLEAVFLIMRLPAWGRTLKKRAASAPKVHVVDSGLAARLLRLSPEKLAHRDPSSLSQFGHLLETFVVGELIRQASWLDQVSVCGHWRTYEGDEVDLVIERDDGRLLAFEVKAASRVDSSSMRHLAKLRDELGERFLAGVTLYTGTRSYQLDERLLVAPIDRLWTPV